MILLLACVIGGLYAAGVYLMLRRSLFRLILGLVLLSHGANLLIFAGGGLHSSRAPIVGESGESLAPLADPVPQALILTAIVISFGVLAFSLALFHRAHQVLGTDNSDKLASNDS